MDDILTPLQSWAESAIKLELTPVLLERLGRASLWAQNNAAIVDVYVFRYPSAGSIVAGFLVAPKQPPKDKLPVIIFNRGGTKDFGTLKNGMLFTHIGDFAKWGYCIIGSQYPGNSFSEGKDEWGGEDVDAIGELHNLIRAMPMLDPHRIGMLGGSRGGMMTYLCLSRYPWIKAAATTAGVSNLIRNSQQRPEMQEVFEEAFGGDLAAKKLRSAVHWADKLNPSAPLLLLHGAADRRVSPLDATELAQALLATGRTNIALRIYEEDDHSLSQHHGEWQLAVKQWFDKYLGSSDL